MVTRTMRYDGANYETLIKHDTIPIERIMQLKRLKKQLHTKRVSGHIWKDPECATDGDCRDK